MDGWLLVLTFALLWLVTFWPAWKLFLVIASEIVRPGKARYWKLIGLFIIYRVIIALPYLAVLIFGMGTIGPLLSGLIVGFLFLGLVTSVFRLFATSTVIGWLWQVYSRVYDGLLHFYPYRHLLELQAERVQASAATIVDLGCGSGNMLPLLIKKAPKARIVAVDPTSGMLKRAKRKVPGADVEFVQSDALSFLRSQKSASVEVIVMSNVLYTFEDRAAMWPELMRVLTPGGRAIVTNSDRAGSGTIIREHLNNDAWWKLLHPNLLLTGVVDAFISELSKVGAFHFVDQKTLEIEVEQVGGTIANPVRCYGGSVDGVNLLFTVEHR